MKKLEKIIISWGLLDLLAVTWYGGLYIYHKRFPLVHDVQRIIANTTSFGTPSLKYILFFAILIYFSLVISGFYLIKLKKAGAIISYFQTPFRLLLIIPPSLFFILWPFKFLFDPPQLIIAFTIVALSEVLKIGSVAIWHRQLSIA